MMRYVKNFAKRVIVPMYNCNTHMCLVGQDLC